LKQVGIGRFRHLYPGSSNPEVGFQNRLMCAENWEVETCTKPLDLRILRAVFKWRPRQNFKWCTVVSYSSKWHLARGLTNLGRGESSERATKTVGETAARRRTCRRAGGRTGRCAGSRRQSTLCTTRVASAKAGKASFGRPVLGLTLLGRGDSSGHANKCAGKPAAGRRTCRRAGGRAGRRAGVRWLRVIPSSCGRRGAVWGIRTLLDRPRPERKLRACDQDCRRDGGEETNVQKGGRAYGQVCGLTASTYLVCTTRVECKGVVWSSGARLDTPRPGR
jgi:hypothetical protein